MPIQTNRLILRLFTPTDYPALREMDSDPAVLRYRSRAAISEQETREFLERALRAHQETPRSHFAYALISKKNPEWVGECGLTLITDEEDSGSSAFMWYSLLPRYWGFGYMTEAAAALLQVGFLVFGFQVIKAECDPFNVPAARVLERVGLHYEGSLNRTDEAGNTRTRLRYTMHSRDYGKVPHLKLIIEEPY